MPDVCTTFFWKDLAVFCKCYGKSYVFFRARIKWPGQTLYILHKLITRFSLWCILCCWLNFPGKNVGRCAMARTDWTQRVFTFFYWNGRFWSELKSDFFFCMAGDSTPAPVCKVCCSGCEWCSGFGMGSAPGTREKAEVSNWNWNTDLCGSYQWTSHCPSSI